MKSASFCRCSEKTVSSAGGRRRRATCGTRMIMTTWNRRLSQKHWIRLLLGALREMMIQARSQDRQDGHVTCLLARGKTAVSKRGKKGQESVLLSISTLCYANRMRLVHYSHYFSIRREWRVHHDGGTSSIATCSHYTFTRP